MKNENDQIEGLTIVVLNMKQLLDFYSNVFKIEFIEKEMNGSKL